MFKVTVHTSYKHHRSRFGDCGPAIESRVSMPQANKRGTARISRCLYTRHASQLKVSATLTSTSSIQDESTGQCSHHPAAPKTLPPHPRRVPSPSHSTRPSPRHSRPATPTSMAVTQPTCLPLTTRHTQSHHYDLKHIQTRIYQTGNKPQRSGRPGKPRVPGKTT